jgi:hypothetical protein
MTKFESRFFRALNEQDEQSMERQAMERSLEKGTSPSEFDVSPTNSNTDTASQHLAAAAEVTAQQHNEYIRQIEGWIVELTKIYEFLNAPGSTSVLSVISNAPAKSILKTELGSTDSGIERAAKEISIIKSAFEASLAKRAAPELAGV